MITDDTVDKLYSDVVMKSLSDAGFETFKFVFPHGEKSKNISTFSSILEFLAESGLTRTDALVALGGGVVGDVAGFAAASYLRGIDFIQIPTTLLACVDSSVGGKTAIDLKAGKNLAARLSAEACYSRLRNALYSYRRDFCRRNGRGH